MVSDSGQRLRQVAIPIVVGVVHFLAYFPFARLGVDPHHDGIMLHPALMVERGFVVHRDVFSQYGPLTSIVHAGFVRLLGPSLWSIRVGSCLLLAGANAILFAINRKLFGVGLATVATFLSLSLAYFFSPTAPMHPWPSDLMILMVALCAWLVLSGLESSQSMKACLFLFAAGCVGSWIPFVRQAVGASLLVLVIVAVVLVRRRWLLPIIAGFIAGSAITICYFLISNSFSQFWEQSVTGPWHWALRERGEGGWASVRGNLLNTGLPGAMLLAFGSWLTSEIVRIETKNGSLRGRLLTLIIACSAFFVFAQSDGSVLEINREGLLWSLGLAGLGLIASSVIRLRATGLLSGNSLISTCVLATASLSIFPVTDVRHAYWAFLPLIGSGLFLVSRVANQTRSRSFAAICLCALLSFQTVTTVQRTLRVPRAEVSATPVLQHMLFDKDYLRFFETRFSQVARYRERYPNVMVLNICSDGLFSSLASIKALPDPYFVSWNFGLDFFNPKSVVGKTRLEFIRRERPIVWMCPLTENPELLSRLYGLTLLEKDRSVPTEDQYGWWPYVSYLGVPTEWVNDTREYKQ